MLHVDAHFAGGHAHPVCQDYALCSRDAAVVCDGCSSAPHSDVGARLLAHAALRASSAGLLGPGWLRGPAAAQRALALPPRSLDATCIVARATDDAVRVTVLGDGVLAARRRVDDAVLLAELDYPASAPPYPSYALDDERSRAYDEAGWGDPTLHADPGLPPPTRQGRGWSWLFPKDTFRAVLIGSDGLRAFHTSDGGEVPTRAVVEVLFDYPSPRGAFVTRRLRRYLTRQAPAQGHIPHDDVAVAALCWGER